MSAATINYQSRLSNIEGNNLVLPAKIIVTMPAYNAAKTLLKTFEEIPKGLVAGIILVDDFSTDETVNVGSSLDIKVIRHPHNVGYGVIKRLAIWKLCVIKQT